MAMKALRDGAKGGVLKFFLLGILCLAAGGLVFTDVGGFFRGGGIGGNDVAKIGRDKISLPEFDNILRRTLAPLGITPAQANQLGYTREILNNEIRRRILFRTANEYGITIDQEQIVAQIGDILAPAIQSGLSPQAALDNLLRQQGMSEAGLMHTIASEKALSLLNNALQSGTLVSSNALNKDLYSFQNETRDIRYLPLLNKDYEGIEAPGEAVLRQMYEATKNAYAIAETRDLQIIHIKTDAIKNSIAISDETLQGVYEDNIVDYEQEASRTIAQALAKTQEDAQKIADAAKGGKDLKSLVKGGDYLPPKTFTEDSILDELADAVFEAEKTGALDPIETPLGWTVVEVQKITPAQTQSFESVKDTIRDDLLEDQLIDEIYALLDEIDDVFAAGGAPEDAAKQFNLEIEEFEEINSFGLDASNKKALADALGETEAKATQIAFDLDEGETSSALELAGGDFAAISVKAITPKTYQEFDAIKDTLEKRWIDDNRALSNRNFAKGVLDQNQDQPLTDIAKTLGKKIKKNTALKRDTAPKAPLAPRSINAAFEAAPGALFLMDIDGGIAIAEITNVQLPEKTNKDAVAKIEQKILQDIQNEVFSTYIGNRSDDYGTSINQRLIDQYYTQQSEN